MSRKTKNSLVNTAISALLFLLSLIWSLPVFGIFIESFHCIGGPDGAPAWGFDNYVRLFRETLFLRWFGNTLLVGTASAIVQTAFQLAVGYTFSRLRFRRRKFLMGLFLVLGMFPAPMTLVVVNSWLREWNLTGANAPYGSILIYMANSGLGYAVVKGYFDTIDRSITEAALVDGATQLQIFLKIFLPLAKPIIVYTLLMGFLMPWNDLSMVDAILPGYMVGDGLQWILDAPIEENFELFCAGGVVVSVPIVILFLILQKYYVMGETIRTFGRTSSPSPSA